MINPDMTGLAALGRGEDNYLAHVAKGEMIVPPLGISEDTRNRLKAEMKAVGLDPNKYIVGSGMSINPITNLPEFGFFKKLGKSITKVLDPIAEVAAVVPGPHQPFARAYTTVDKSLEQKKFGKRAAAQTAKDQVMPSFVPNTGLPSIFGQNQTPEIIKRIGDLFGFGGRSGLEDVYGPDGILRGINPVTAGLASLYGLATQKAAEKERFGIKDVRGSIRPDLARSSNMGIAGFDVGFANGGEVLDMRAGGESIGPGTGTSDDIPAMLSDGEFVMTAAANKGLGGYKVSPDKTHKEKGVICLTPVGKPDRKKGADNMMDLMKTFEKYDKAFA
jgi:hypothetical protein|tara:strand:+ start:5293 stop:6288 length:996 start_codon:yes stop_codon:yes gene_type:complete